MPNLVIIYPTISQADFDTIQAIRKVHDQRYFDVVKPHITLVFGTTKLSVDELTEHVRNKLAGFKAFPIRFDSAKVVEDDSKTFFHTFLIPSEGYDQINKLHDILYTDQLASELRHDIPFIPHVGIGTSVNEADMVQLAKTIHERGLVINGTVDKVSIVEYDGSKVVDCEEVLLT